MLAPSDGGFNLLPCIGNLYAMTGRKALLLEDKQILSVGVFDKVFLALGWILEEIHVTWAHLEKKEKEIKTPYIHTPLPNDNKIQTYIIFHEDLWHIVAGDGKLPWDYKTTCDFATLTSALKLVVRSTKLFKLKGWLRGRREALELESKGIFFIDVFGDQAFQRINDIHKVDVDTLLSYLVMATNINTPENQRFSCSNEEYD
ncbi:hypothetical protein Tco_0725735 [Tanacetum coccineum]|uniref:Uncharacterized protein n=1 Tax=Tanacetum coccineum TaxID=301880 RepID=A0ABQ4YDR0_9ASTR